MYFIVADDSWKIVVFVVFLVIAIAVIYFEFKFLRRKRHSEVKVGTYEDQAHNAIITTRAIYSTLARGGVRSGEADELLKRAEEARAVGDHKVAIDYASSARTALMKEKQKQQMIGDIAKVPAEAVGPSSTSEETTKEKLQKEIPKNYVQSKFMLSYARQAVKDGGRTGRSLAEATRLLDLAQKSFDDRDFDNSLKLGFQARRAAEGMVVEVTPRDAVVVGVSVEARNLSCKSCGALLATGDLFCRKCGVKVETVTCPSCGTKPREGDTFCRKCGVALD